jgi:hypothetical protein
MIALQAKHSAIQVNCPAYGAATRFPQTKTESVLLRRNILALRLLRALTYHTGRARRGRFPIRRTVFDAVRRCSVGRINSPLRRSAGKTQRDRRRTWSRLRCSGGDEAHGGGFGLVEGLPPTRGCRRGGRRFGAAARDDGGQVSGSKRGPGETPEPRNVRVRDLLRTRALRVVSVSRSTRSPNA